jgi:glutathione-specific gamma-glutamylcyclotransferase
MTPLFQPPPSAQRDPQPLLNATIAGWRAEHQRSGHDLWLFAYGSLIWKPEMAYTERQLAKVCGWHRALKMWSRVNRGSPECPGLVFALLRGGSCKGVAYRVPAGLAEATITSLWPREMPTGVYDPRFVPCTLACGSAVQALALTLSHDSPWYTGNLDDAALRQIFSDACGRYGSTKDYALSTLQALRDNGIEDEALATLLQGFA